MPTNTWLTESDIQFGYNHITKWSKQTIDICYETVYNIYIK